MFSVRHSSWCLMAIVLTQVAVNAHNAHHRSGTRVVRQSHNGPSMLLGAAGLVAVAESATPIQEPSTVGRGRHSMRVKRSEIEFEIDEAMVLRVAAMDESGCGARLLCELHQEEPAQLNGTIARRLVQIFDGQQPPNFEALRTEPKAAFQYAAFVGSNSGKNLKTCPNVFDRCPFNAKIILEVLNSRSAGFLSEEAESTSTTTLSPTVNLN